MRRYELEGWANKAVDCASSGRPVEDSFVELKAELPTDLDRAARQLAGHANAAAGEDILWLIGIREDGFIQGAKRDEVSRWYSSVKKHFDGIYPGMQCFNVARAGKTVVALRFSTGDSPYIVNRAVGIREIPWREANSTRSAKRDEILRLLHETVQLPSADFRGGELEARQLRDFVTWQFKFGAEFYLIPRNIKPITIPVHLCSGYFEIEGLIRRTQFQKLWIRQPENRHAPYHVTIKRPDMLYVGADVEVRRSRRFCGGDYANVVIVLNPVNSPRPLNLSCSVPLKATGLHPEEVKWLRMHNARL